jgi:hypothetical protein
MSKATDDHILAVGRSDWMLKLYKWVTLILGAVALITSSGWMVTYLAREDRIIPIEINAVTGEARPIDFSVIDATGEERKPVEVKRFAEDLIGELYTFNRFTTQSNLKRVLSVTTPGAKEQIEQSIDLPARVDLISRNGQSVAQIENVTILEGAPILKVQLLFQVKTFSQSQDNLSGHRYLTAIKLKVTRRTEKNPHGIYVIEYRQSSFQEKK